MFNSVWRNANVPHHRQRRSCKHAAIADHQRARAWAASAAVPAVQSHLAYCPDKERDAILQRLRKSDKPEDRLARDPRRLDRILAETRQRGYGTRDPVFPGGAYGSPPVDDGLAAIAIPLLDGTRVHG